MSEIIKVENLVKTYVKGFLSKRVLALDEASFSVRSGRITGFIGANGAGKTTTLRCLLEFTRVDSGSFSFFGTPGLDMSVRKKIGYLPEHPHFYGFLTGYEFLKFYSDLSGVIKTRSQILEALEGVGLEHAAFRPLSGYSKGMLQRAGLAQALVHSPELLILDEPMSGLDPDGRRLVKSVLERVSSEGVTLFFSTHLLDDAEDLCDDLVLMAHGKVVYNGELETVLLSPSGEFQIFYYDSRKEGLLSRSIEGRQKLRDALGEILSSGGEVVEVRPRRKTLENVFSRLTGERAING